MLLFALQSNAQNIDLVFCNNKVIEVIMDDVFNAPVASRIHAYSNIAAYEVAIIGNHKYTSVAGQLTDFTSIPTIAVAVNHTHASWYTHLYTAQKFVYSEYKIDAAIGSIDSFLFTVYKDTTAINNLHTYAKQVANHIFDWAKKDNYIYTRTLSRYVLSDSLGAWQPTAPDYGNALEPNFSLMRSFVAVAPLYVPITPNNKYSSKKNSACFKNALALNKLYTNLDSTKIKTALYWDDNPKTLITAGHMGFFIHKVSPGGHWLKITGQATQQNNFNNVATAHTYMLASIAMYEGFLNCWSQKYISNSIRPETYIQRCINNKFKPVIETPPFPEYPSGHSTVSAAISTILMQTIPQPFTFTDSSQAYLNMPLRTYNSFSAAAQEASISRYYGGIHFMPALNNGAKHGTAIANYILKKIKTTL